jgi:uncharacterized OB-fold protein
MAEQRKISFIGTPDTNPEVKPYWDACNEGRLVLRKCGGCGKVHYYPRGICPFCFSTEGSWVGATGKGKIYSYSVMERANPPFTMAYVTLSEGVTMMTNIVECDFSTVKIGQDVTVVFMDTDTGQKVPMFKPA